MSEPTPTPTPPPADPKASTPPAPAPTPAPPGDPAELGDAGKKALDAERTARKAAEKATADLQAQIDKLNQANESAVEKATREATEAKETAAKATTEALRYRVAAKHGISTKPGDDGSPSDADLFLTGSDEETVERQAAALAARTSTSPKPDLSQGAKGAPAGASPEQDFANFLGAQMSGRG